MADARYWSKETITSFIEIYKSYPCLWKIKCKDYTNRNLKNAAYDKLVEFCKTINPEANRDYVVKKIQSFRGSFRKELKKVEDSKRSGAGADEIHTPTLWYFDQLVFTIDQELPTPSVCNILEEDSDSLTEEAQVKTMVGSYKRKSNRLSWSEKDMKAAIEAIEVKEMDWLKASRSVPFGTLIRRVGNVGRNRRGYLGGKRTAFSAEW
ncbi:hypothetical protein FQR65_LT05550 [Abscondita terminalis]|nr:hypothetical protein FQR65_LT05550 [Abscondita terminalis]